MYLRQIDAVENALIPKLLIDTIYHYLQSGKTTDFNEMLNMLAKDVKLVVGNNSKFYKAVNGLSRRVFKYFYENKFNTRKCFITIKRMAEELEANEIIHLFDGTRQAFDDIDFTINKAIKTEDLDSEYRYTPEEMEKIITSCEKHATKLIAKLQKDGYY